MARFNGGAAVMRQTQNGWKSTFTLELAYPPFAYVLSIDEESPAVETGNISSRFQDESDAGKGSEGE
jgi:hypothetical protein